MSQQRMPHPLELNANYYKGNGEANNSFELMKIALANTTAQAQQLQQDLDKARKRISELEPNTKKEKH